MNLSNAVEEMQGGCNVVSKANWKVAGKAVGQQEQTTRRLVAGSRELAATVSSSHYLRTIEG